MKWIELKRKKNFKILNPPGQFYFRSKEIFSKQNQLNTRKIRILYSVVFFMHKMSWPEISLCLSLSYWARGKWIAISRGKWHAKSHLAIEQGGGTASYEQGKMTCKIPSSYSARGKMARWKYSFRKTMCVKKIHKQKDWNLTYAYHFT